MRPIRIVFPLAAGAGGDVFTCALEDELQKAWHQPVVVENRPGAGKTSARAPAWKPCCRKGSTCVHGDDGHYYCSQACTLHTVNVVDAKSSVRHW